MKRVRKAIIPAAGLGTRFLPATKALAKEMLPIVDKPTIQFIVEEARKSGIEDIVVVDGKNKRSIEDHFDSNPELEETTDINIYFIRQSHPRGLGDAVLTARDFIGDEPFVVMLGDDLNNINNDGEPLTKQLIESYEQTGASTLAVMRVPHEDTAKYGVINPSKEVTPGLFNVTSFVEKPDPKKAPSDLAIIGRYVFTPEIFDVLAKTKPGKGGEIQLTDAINTLNKTQRVFAHEYTGDRYDVGNKFGWIQTNIEYGLQHPQTKDELREYIKNLGAKLSAEDQKKTK